MERKMTPTKAFIIGAMLALCMLVLPSCGSTPRARFNNTKLGYAIAMQELKAIALEGNLNKEQTRTIAIVDRVADKLFDEWKLKLAKIDAGVPFTEQDQYERFFTFVAFAISLARHPDQINSEQVEMMLLQYPDLAKEAQQEIDTILGPEETTSWFQSPKHSPCWSLPYRVRSSSAA